MTIKQFIEKAIKGGYIGVNPSGKLGHWSGSETPNFEENIKAVLLDPLAWKAVGKIEGWEEKIKEYTWSNKAGNTRQVEASEWQNLMYWMIDYLTEGKTIEEFLETL